MTDKLEIDLGNNGLNDESILLLSAPLKSYANLKVFSFDVESKLDLPIANKLSARAIQIIIEVVQFYQQLEQVDLCFNRIEPQQFMYLQEVKQNS